MRKYNRLTKKELKNIQKLIDKEYSLNEITKITRKKKTTIYYHFRKIKGRTMNPITIKSNNKELIGEFIGLFAGDGCIDKTDKYQYRTYLYFNLNEKKFVEDLIKNVLIKLFGKRPMVFKVDNRINLCYYSKTIHKLIHNYLIWNKKIRKTYTVELKNKNHSKEFLRGFIRGSVDSDGHISNKRINFASVSYNLIRDIACSLEKLDIKYKLRKYIEKRENRKDIYHIDLRKPEFEMFHSLIKPRNVKCTGRDLNSWT
ncbi:hypothetical protein HOC35_04105 [Candidatus Woesearchaeota archaeon]|jgi:hypothetical protein|nr:hypothetical protein [Candidatus Woesearchaeota archaeon]